MNGSAPRIPDPKELEREISEFLSKKFGGHVKVLSPVVMAEESPAAVTPETPRRKTRVDFNLKPEELIAYLDRYVVRQDQAKAILATKICTHFNRIRRAQEKPEIARGADAYLDQYVVRQDQAKAILATKICTHFNRIRRAQEYAGDRRDRTPAGSRTTCS